MPTLRLQYKDLRLRARSWAASSRNGRADRFIVRLCELIKRLAGDKLHIGDLFDRGPGLISY